MERNEWRVQLDVDGTRGVVEVSLMAERGHMAEDWGSSERWGVVTG